LTAGERPLHPAPPDATSAVPAAAVVAKGSFVEDLVEGLEVEGVFLVQRKSSRRTREGRPFLALVLYDRTGVVDAQVWDDAAAFGVPFAERDFIRVRGVVDRYRDRLQLRVLESVVCRWEELSPDDFLPRSARPPEEMLGELRARIETIANPFLRDLLARLEADRGFLRAFVTAPAASAVHHDYVGGLLEHTLSLMALVDAVGRVYRDLDRDLLMTGAFLHDVGKVREISALPGFPYTDEGRLLGHIVLGYEMAMRAADRVPGFPPELRTELGHLILSHQGEYEWGSPKRPKTLEAIALHFLDNLDSKVNVFRKAVAAGGLEGEEGWTDYVRTLGRALYRGRRTPGKRPLPTTRDGTDASEGRTQAARDATDPSQAPGSPSRTGERPPPDLFGEGG
jgi:3'-5' exoribonuclease